VLGLRYFPYYSYCRNPTVGEFFIPAGTLLVIAVKLNDFFLCCCHVCCGYLVCTVATIKIHNLSLSCVVSHLFAFDPIKACYYLDITDAVIENMLNLKPGS